MPSADPSAQVELALRVSAAVVSLEGAYSDLLHSMILPYPLPGYDRMDLIRYRKILDDDEAYSFLLVIWRHSRYVTDEVLSKVKLVRHGPKGSITAWGLATKLATSADEVAKTNNRIRVIGLAGEAFGLIERDKRRTTNRPLAGTELLHKFILRLSEDQSRLFAELGPFLPPVNVVLDLPKPREESHDD